MRAIAIAVVFLLTACGRGEYGEMDHKVVCSPDRKTAYYVEPSVGATAFLRKSPQFIKLCEETK